MSFAPKTCLIVGPSWVGDMVMAQSLFIELKQRSPDIQIDVLAPVWSKPLLAAMPEVRTAIEMPLTHGQLGLKARYRLGKSLRDRDYDWAITLPRSLKSSLVPFWAKAKVRTGYLGEMRYGLLNDIRALDKSVLTMTVQRFVALGLDKNAAHSPQITPPRLQVDPVVLQATRTKFVANARPVLALCPGAEYGEAKRWPASYFAEVATAMIKQGWQVLLLGSAKDQAITQSIHMQVASEFCSDLAGQTSIEEVIALLALADRVVSNDSGLMHVAAAVDTPVVAIYGSSDPTYTPPLSDNAQIISLSLECSPCFKRECPLGHLDCLNDIKPEQVLSGLAD